MWKCASSCPRQSSKAARWAHRAVFSHHLLQHCSLVSQQPLPLGCPQVSVSMQPSSIKVCVRDGTEEKTLMEGEFTHKINTENSLWSLEPGRCVVVSSHAYARTSLRLSLYGSWRFIFLNTFVPAVPLQDIRGLVERSAERRRRNWREQNQPRALHGDGGRGGARCPRQTDLRLPSEAAGKTAEPRDGERLILWHCLLSWREYWDLASHLNRLNH